MALHVRHRFPHSTTRYALFSLSVVVGLFVAAITVARSVVGEYFTGSPGQAIHIVLCPEHKETIAVERIEPPNLTDAEEPATLYLIETSPLLGVVENAPIYDIPELTDVSTPIIAAELLVITDEPKPITSAKHSVKIPQISANYTPPQYAANPQPPYPKDLLRRRISGTVRVRIHINASGSPTAVDILSSSHPSFAQAAKQTILSAWHFTPATAGASCVAATVNTSIVFSLN